MKGGLPRTGRVGMDGEKHSTVFRTLTTRRRVCCWPSHSPSDFLMLRRKSRRYGRCRCPGVGGRGGARGRRCASRRRPGRRTARWSGTQRSGPRQETEQVRRSVFEVGRSPSVSGGGGEGGDGGWGSCLDGGWGGAER